MLEGRGEGGIMIDRGSVLIMNASHTILVRGHRHSQRGC